MNDPPDDVPPQAEETWQQVDQKVILAQILTELQQIRMALTAGAQERESDSDMYECQRCNATVQADERQRHAESEHRAPPDMAESLFTRKD